MTEAQKRASDKYRQSTEELSVSLPKGTKADWKQQAQERGIKLWELIYRAVEEYLGKH